MNEKKKKNSNHTSQPSTKITFQNKITHIQETKQKKLYYGKMTGLKDVFLTKSFHLPDPRVLPGRSSRRIR